MNTEAIQTQMKDLLPDTLGIRFEEATRERVVGSLEVTDRVCTLPGVLHGGAIMALADTLGAVGTFLNLPPGTSTTTLESKTNFLAAGRGGSTVRGEATPLKIGRRAMIWQTRVSAEDGTPIAIVTQTQMVLEPAKSPAETLTSFFAGRTVEEQKKLLATLERAGAGLYRSWAESESDGGSKAALLAAAEREEENASLLEQSNGSKR